MMKIAILTIGDEVVSGKIVNTNASYLAKILETNQFKISKHLAVRDEEEEILKGLAFLYDNANIVITTGGLGPTVDDLTKEICARYFNEKMIFIEDVFNQIKTYYEKTKRKMPSVNKKQAYFIKDAIVIPNDNGTAPGMIYEKEHKIIINLPGPPKELEPMLHHVVLPYLKDKWDIESLKKQYRLMNIGESDAETILQPLYQKYTSIKIAPYASVGVVDYMLSIENKDNQSVFDRCCDEFEQYLGEYIIGDWSKTIQELVVELLRKNNLTLAIAESCTGGMVSAKIVDVSGSSHVLKEGVVTYSNEAKMKRLGVLENTLIKHGAVSEETAREMALGVKSTSGADIGISITGIAGPTGGTKEKPVGLVYSAICFNGKTQVYRNYCVGDRYKIRLRSTMLILYKLYCSVIKTL